MYWFWQFWPWHHLISYWNRVFCYCPPLVVGRTGWGGGSVNLPHILSSWVTSLLAGGGRLLVTWVSEVAACSPPQDSSRVSSDVGVQCRRNRTFNSLEKMEDECAQVNRDSRLGVYDLLQFCRILWFFIVSLYKFVGLKAEHWKPQAWCFSAVQLSERLMVIGHDSCYFSFCPWICVWERGNVSKGGQTE